jgi:hypothetical protein
MVLTTPDEPNAPTIRQAFTLVIDADAATAYAGRSQAQVMIKYGTGVLITGLTINDAPTAPVTAWGALDLSNLDLEYDPASGLLTGVGTVTSAMLSGAAGRPRPAGLTGWPDATSPRVAIAPDTGLFDPFLGFAFFASEPLPPTAAARLVSSGGRKNVTFDLQPLYAGDPSDTAIDDPEAPSGAIFAFGKPEVVLAFGASYELLLDRVTDFAGRVASADDRFQFVTPLLPPVTPQDGFESADVQLLVTGGVVDAQTFPVLAGNHSLFVTAGELRALACSPAQMSLTTLRLAVPAGATTLRFSYRAVSRMARATAQATVSVGSEGGSIARADLVTTLAPAKVALTMGARYLGDPRTFELALPADAGPEVLVDLAITAAGCGLPRSPYGFLVDDVRVE